MGTIAGFHWGNTMSKRRLVAVPPHWVDQLPVEDWRREGSALFLPYRTGNYLVTPILPAKLVELAATHLLRLGGGAELLSVEGRKIGGRKAG